MTRGLEPLSRHEIHGMVLRQAREKAIEEPKLRAVGLFNYRAASRPQKKTGEEGRHIEPVGERPAEKEERICNHCGVCWIPGNHGLPEYL